MSTLLIAAAELGGAQAAARAAHPILVWASNTFMGEFVRGSSWAFPFFESVHFLGMSLLIGIIGALDLRVLGFARAVPLAPLHRFLPLAFIGFGLNVISGLGFFCQDPFQYAFNPAFRIKMLLILLAGLNALWFRLGPFMNLESWGPGIEASRLAKVVSALSLLLWVSIITAGRYIGFT
jgi:hypothetical protein